MEKLKNSESTTTADKNGKQSRTLSHWATAITLTTTVSAVFLYYLGHAYTIGWLERAGLPPNLFPVSFADMILTGGRGMSAPVLRLMLTPEAFFIVFGWAFVNVGVVFLAALAGAGMAKIWSRFVHPWSSGIRQRNRHSTVSKYYREHERTFQQIFDTMRWLFAYPFIAYYSILIVGTLFVVTSLGMHSAGVSAAERVLAARQLGLTKPEKCGGSPRVTWQDRQKRTHHGATLICSETVCGVVTATGVHTVPISMIVAMHAACPMTPENTKRSEEEQSAALGLQESDIAAQVE